MKYPLNNNFDSMKPKKFVVYATKAQKLYLDVDMIIQKIWEFLCQECLSVIKLKHKDNYQYGGTKKFK